MKHGPGTSERTTAGLSAGYDHLLVLHRFVASQDEGRPSLPGDPKRRRLIVGRAREIIFDMKYEIAHILSIIPSASSWRRFCVSIFLDVSGMNLAS